MSSQNHDLQPILSGGRFTSLETQDGQTAHDTSTAMPANRTSAPNSDMYIPSANHIFVMKLKRIEWMLLPLPDHTLSHTYLWLSLDLNIDSGLDCQSFHLKQCSFTHWALLIIPFGVVSSPACLVNTCSHDHLDEVFMTFLWPLSRVLTDTEGRYEATVLCTLLFVRTFEYFKLA